MFTGRTNRSAGSERVTWIDAPFDRGQLPPGELIVQAHTAAQNASTAVSLDVDGVIVGRDDQLERWGDLAYAEMRWAAQVGRHTRPVAPPPGPTTSAPIVTPPPTTSPPTTAPPPTITGFTVSPTAQFGTCTGNRVVASVSVANATDVSVIGLMDADGHLVVIPMSMFTISGRWVGTAYLTDPWLVPGAAQWTATATNSQGRSVTSVASTTITRC